MPWLHPGQSAYLVCGGERVGVFGRLANDVTAELKLPKDSRTNLNIFLGEIDYADLMKHACCKLCYRPLSAFPTVERDLALVVEESAACGTIGDAIRHACPQVSKVELFDIYRGEKLGAGKKSMAFRLYFQPADKALEPADVDRFIKKILGNLKYKLGIEIRE